MNEKCLNIERKRLSLLKFHPFTPTPSRAGFFGFSERAREGGGERVKHENNRHETQRLLEELRTDVAEQFVGPTAILPANALAIIAR